MDQTNGNAIVSDRHRTNFDDTSERNAWIVFQLRKKGTSLSKLSFSHGLGRTSMAQALHRPYPKAEAIIATEIGIDPDVLFFDRYLDGERIDRRRNRHA